MTEELGRQLLAALQEQTRELRALRRALAPAGTLSIEEAAEELGCSVSRVYELIKKGKLVRAKKAGRHTRVTTASLRAYQDLDADGAPPPAALKVAPNRGTRFRALAKKSQAERTGN
ncbi:MAG: helix-turn-helix domain-containing protein [Deltaproteobacteria bacterium]|nr:helix-turn-helix domain-containing protein [Deltaproteobacteria bacterium]